MGFDFVDKQFQRKEIKLECECCQQAGSTVQKREATEAILCNDCYSQFREQEYAALRAKYW